MSIKKEEELISYSPTSYNEVLEIIASRHNLPKSTIETIVKHPFSRIREHVSNGTAAKIKIRRFGTISTYSTLVDKNIKLWIESYRKGLVTKRFAIKKVSELWKMRDLWIRNSK